MKNIFKLLLGTTCWVGAGQLAAQCPTITCPSNIVTTSTAGNCGASVTFTAPVGTNPCAGSSSQVFNYTGGTQTFTVPSGVTSVTIEALGAQGGGTNGGLGGRAVATVPVTSGEVLNVYVGGMPLAQIGAGGYNGGGSIIIEPCGGGSTNSFPGGGASDVRRGTALGNRLIVAGGGGGQGWSSGLGGAGGGTTGTDGAASWIAGTHGRGATQSAGGAGGYYSGNGGTAPSGTLGVGGNSAPLDTYCTGGAGGGGYYGGGGGYVSAGGGGSSYVSYPGNTATSTTAGQRTGHGQITISWSGVGVAPTTTQIAGPASGGNFPVGATNVTFEVNDNVGSTASCTFTVTVNDVENPDINCGANLTVNTDPGVCSATVNYNAPTATDNCNNFTVAPISGQGIGGTFALGTSTETWRATDGGGNTDDCSFTITVVDGENPTITCPSNMTVNADPGACSAVVNYNAPQASDNCSIGSAILTAGLSSGSIFPSGVTTQTFSATDAAGNSATCSFDVTVVAANLSSTQNLTICAGQTVTVGGNTYSTAGTYTDILTSTGGCDSTVTTVLAVTTVNVNTTVTNTTVTANQGNATYQWLDCNNNFAPIAGQTSQSYVATSNGSYAVIVTINGCSDTSACRNVIVVGMEDKFGNEFKLYPNPSNGQVSIDFGQVLLQAQLQVMDVTGKVVHQANVANTTNTQIDLRHLSRGMYNVKVSTDTESTILKLVIQ